MKDTGCESVSPSGNHCTRPREHVGPHSNDDREVAAGELCGRDVCGHAYSDHNDHLGCLLCECDGYMADGVQEVDTSDKAAELMGRVTYTFTTVVTSVGHVASSTVSIVGEVDNGPEHLYQQITRATLISARRASDRLETKLKETLDER